MRFPKQFITSGALARSALSAGDLRVLLVLIAVAGEDSVVVATQTEIADMAGLSRKSIRAALARLVEQGLVGHESRQGMRTDYTVLPSYKAPQLGTSEGAKDLAPSRAKWVPSYPQELGTPEGAKSDGNLAPLKVPTPKSDLTRVRNSPTGTSHPFEQNAIAKLERLRKDRHFTIPIPELLTTAYRLGNGDPWEGTQYIDQATAAAATGARDINAIMRHRIKQLEEGAA